jgi:cytochrome c-type biogenesis protein CcsB
MKNRKQAKTKSKLPNRSPIIRRTLRFLFSMQFSLAAGFVFAAAIGAATFIEARHGTETARSAVYNAAWFEILLGLIGLNLAANIFKHRIWRRGKDMVFLFHAAFLLILIGAGVTRHFGFEGIMHIREGSQTNSVLSNDAFLMVSLRHGDQRIYREQPLSISKAANSRFNRTWNLNGKTVRLRLVEGISGAEKKLASAVDGKPGCSLVLMDGEETDRRTLFELDSMEWKGVHFLFSAGDAPAPSGAVVQIKSKGGSPFFSSGLAVGSMDMTGRTRKTNKPGLSIPLTPQVVYTAGTVRFVLEQYVPSGRVEAVRPPEPANGNQGGAVLEDALVIEASVSGRMRTVSVFGVAGEVGTEEYLNLDGVKIFLAYGSKDVRLPFSLSLNDFRIDRYPGSMKPSGFTSEVTVTDRDEAVEKPVSIFMNHILRHRGYRFYQSSYDEDERGTVLSVSRDPGMLPTYAGYLLLAMGLVFNLFSSRSRFRLLGQTLKKSATAVPAAFIAVWLFSTAADARPFEGPGKIGKLEGKTSRLFGMLAVQDNQGRIKPVLSLAKEMIRGESRLNALPGLDPDRFALWTFAFPEETGPSGYFDDGIPEKLFRLFPVKNDSSGRWVSAGEVSGRMEREDSVFVSQWTAHFRSSVQMQAWTQADSMLVVLEKFQTTRARGLHPGRFRLKAEVFYNRMDVSARLAPVMFWIGLALLVCSFGWILRPRRNLRILGSVLAILLMAGFLIQTAALGLRWVISGHAPWTNKYESMIFIAWSILLAGMSFGFRNRLTLAGSAVLSGILLSVAGMDWIDPRITTLPPVLKSIWLVIHVSVITSSYGFLALGAVLALFNLLVMIFMTKRSSRFLEPVVEYQTFSIERILTVGLTLLTIGNFLGAVWANESWGRYWGWDPKETWTLVTMLVYAVVLHLRLVRGLGGKVNFNIASLFAIGSVMMTYFGVNLYLSGMHSYASGERPGFPVVVFAVAGVFVVLSGIAWRREKR